MTRTRRKAIRARKRARKLREIGDATAIVAGLLFFIAGALGGGLVTAIT